MTAYEMRISDWSSDVCSADLQAAAVFRHEAPPIEAHVVAVLQHLQDGGVGGRPPDAELFHLLHQAGLAVARRRLGEVLLRQHGAAGDRIALRQLRQAPVAGGFFLAIGGLVVAVFRSEEHTSELQSLMRTSYAVFCLTKQ